MKKYLTIIAIIICGLAYAQTGYLVQPAKWKFIRPQWFDSGMWIKNISKYDGQNRILVYDSIKNTVGYKYISNGATYTAGRGLTLNSNVFRLDTTQGYIWTNTKTIFNGTPLSTTNYGLINIGNGGFSGSANHFTGSSSGTGLAMNMASGSTSDLINLQVGGSSKFKVSNAGTITIAGSLDAGSGSVTANYDNGFNLNGGVGQIVRRTSPGNGIGYYGAASYAQGHMFGLFYGDQYDNTSATKYGVQNFIGMAAGAGSGSVVNTNLKYTINNSGAQTGAFTGLMIDATETSLNGITHNLMNLQVGGSSKFKVDNKGNETTKNGITSGVLFTQTATATVANTTTETTLISTGTGSVTLPADFFEVGKSIVIHGEGIHSATGNPNITIKIKIGGTTYLTTGAVVSGNSTDTYIEIKGTLTCRTVGSSGTLMAQGFYVETGGGDNHFGMANTTTQTINTTTTNTVDVTVQWGTASANNSISLTNLTIEGKN